MNEEVILMSKIISNLVCLLLVFCLLFSLAACGGNSSENKGVSDNSTQVTTGENKDQNTTKETPVLNVLLKDDGQNKWDNNLFVIKEMEKAAGASFNIIPVPDSNMGAKQSTILASGEIPDLMFSSTNSYSLMMEYGPKGLFMPVDQYFDNMPNLKKWIARYPEFTKIMSAADKHIYGFPIINDFQEFKIGLNIREDLLDGMKASDINTLDDLYNVLTILKNKKGNAPWVARDEAPFLEYIAPIFGTGRFVYYNPKQDKFNFGPTEENFKLMINFLAKCYKDGLLHKDAMVMRDQVMEQMLVGDKAYFYIDNMMTCGFFTPDTTKPFVSILPPKVNGERHYGTVNRGSVAYDRIWFVSAKTKYVDNIIKLVDWGYGKEGYETLNWGKEGETYTRNSDGTKKWLIKIHTINSDSNKSLYDYGIYRNFFNTFVWDKESYEVGWLGDYFKNALKLYSDNGVVPPQTPAIVLTQDEIEAKKILEQSLSTYTEENVSKFIMGVSPMSEWEKFIEKLKGMKIEELLKLYDDSYERYKSK